MRWIRPSNAEVFGTGLGNQMGGIGYDANMGTDSYGSCYFGRPGFNYVYGTIEIKMLGEFVDCILNETPSPIDIDQAIDMSLPGIVAHESAMRGGELMEIPRI